jgi:D-proline reductase (dithiol) PrdB
MRPLSERIRPPRTYFVRYPFGHALGEAGNRAQQLQILRDCFNLLESATEPGVIVDSPYRWKRHTFSEPPSTP